MSKSNEKNLFQKYIIHTSKFHWIYAKYLEGNIFILTLFLFLHLYAYAKLCMFIYVSLYVYTHI